MKIKSLAFLLTIPAFGLASCAEQPSEPGSQESSSCAHAWGEYQVTDAYHFRVCSLCGEEGERESHRGGHSTCKDKAICEVCSFAYGTLDDHDYEGAVWQFDEGGTTHYRTCNICQEKESEPHAFTLEVQKEEYLVGKFDASCEATNTYYKSCVCGAHSTSEKDTFEVHSSHDFTEEVVLENDANLIAGATCTTPAIYATVCSKCHEAFDVTDTFEHGEAKGHVYGPLIEKVSSFATYAEAHHHCSECGEYFKEEVVDGVTHYVPATYEEIFDSSKIQALDPAYGTEDKPYDIRSKEDIYYLRESINGTGGSYAGKYFQMRNDIDFALEEGETFGKPIAYADAKPFSGHFDGGNFEIKGLRIAGSSASPVDGLKGDSLSLFSRLTNGTIENLKVKDALVSGDSQRGAVLVARSSGGTIRNVEVSGNVQCTTEGGGIVGCVVSGEPTLIESCVNRANIASIGNDYPNLGGILGANTNNTETDITIRGCVNYGRIDARLAGRLGYSGGVLGLARAVTADHSILVENCVNHGEVITSTGRTSVGGVVGILRVGTIRNCYQNASSKVIMEAADSTQTEATALVGSSPKVGLIVGELAAKGVMEGTNCLCSNEGTLVHKTGDPINIDPTCHSEGKANYVDCLLCGTHISGETLEKTDHQMVQGKDEEGHWTYCANAGCEEATAKEAHNFVKDEENSVEPDYSAPGCDVMVCSACGFEKRVTTFKGCLPGEHVLTYIEQVASTCHTHGVAGHYRCSTCASLFEDAEGTAPTSLTSLALPTVDHQYTLVPASTTFSGTIDEHYVCAYEDHDASEGEYFVKTGDVYAPTILEDLFTASAETPEEGEGTVENPFLITSIEEMELLRTRVNAGQSYAGKHFKLTKDLTFPKGNWGTIGNSDLTPFSGTFDGDNHTLSNYTYSSGDSVALFSRLTNGTIKNLILKNVAVAGTSQRVAGLVARAENAVIENVEISSGTLTCVKQSGGIVGVVIGGATIRNCVNRATITGTSEANGGIVGYLYSGTITIENCQNYASVTGASNGTGGILGASSATSAASPKTVIVRNSTNHARVKGVSYVGGIVGLPRASESSSIIENCKNTGDIEATTGYAGGIAGEARVTVKDCATAIGAVIKVASASITVASDSVLLGGDKATPGAIAGTVLTGIELTNCYIYDSEGNSLTE